MPAAGRTEFLRKSLSAPALARERIRATQALLVATERGDAEAVRQLALFHEAELYGGRAINSRGCEPLKVLVESTHLTHQEQQRVLKEFTELPSLLGAREAATGTTRRAGRPQSSALERELRLSSKARSEMDDTHTGSWASQSLTSWEGAPVTGHKSREMRTTTALTRLTASVHPRALEKVCDAALADPRLLKAPPHTAERALPILVKVLKSEDLAVRTIARNPKLLECEAMRFKKIVPALAATLGSEAEAAYAISVNADLLGIERPQVMRDAVQVVSHCMGSMRDAIWMAVQSIVPLTVTVTARSWTHEAVVGEYTRVVGAQIGERPVYLKPASAMAHLGAKALDVYVLYHSGEESWVFSISSDDPARRSSATARTLHGGADALLLGRSGPTPSSSPDHAPLDGWSFRNPETGAWAADPYARIKDGGRKRAKTILTCTKQQVRGCADTLREALAPFWRQAGPDGVPSARARFVGTPISGNYVHLDGGPGGGRFLDLCGHTMQKGWSFVPLSLEEPLQPTLGIVAWEPVAVHLFYCGEAVRAEEPLEESGTPTNGDQAAAIPAAPPSTEWMEPLKAGGFYVAPDSLPRPELEGVPAIQHVFIRCCPTGRHEIPVPAGPGGLPPLVFAHSQLCAEGRGGVPCEVIKAQSGATVTFDELRGFPQPPPPPPVEEVVVPDKKADKKAPDKKAPDKKAAAAAVEEPPPAPEVPAAPPVARLGSAGELGYSGFLCFRPEAADLACEASEALLRIDTAEPLRLVVAWFPLPPPREAEGGAGAATAEGEETPQGPSRSPPAASLEWARANGWAPYESRIPVTLFPAHSAKAVDVGGMVTKDVGPGQILIPGAGIEVPTIVFLLRTGEPRPDELRALLLRQPSLLAAGDIVALMMRRMRADLGDDQARRILVRQDAPWATVCQHSTASEMEAWVFEQKVAMLAAELQSRGSARALTRDAAVAATPAPQLVERCRALREALGSNASLLDVLARSPQLLTQEASVFPAAFAAVAGALGDAAAKRLLVQRPNLLLLKEQVKQLLDRLLAQFPSVARRRLEEFTFAKQASSEWARWPSMVEVQAEDVAAWLGRVSAEERCASCRERVHSFGAIPNPLQA